MNGGQLRLEVEDFLIHEAWLLDNGRYEEWLDLFTEQIRYWAPVRSNVERGGEDFSVPNLIAHFDDNKFGLTMRVQRIRTGRAHADEPPARVRHVVSNVKILDQKSPDSAHVSSNFICFKSRLGTERFYVGSRQDRLLRAGGQWKIDERCIVFDHDVVDSITPLF